jgi:hypothetical protein
MSVLCRILQIQILKKPASSASLQGRAFPQSLVAVNFAAGESSSSRNSSSNHAGMPQLFEIVSRSKSKSTNLA